MRFTKDFDEAEPPGLPEEFRRQMVDAQRRYLEAQKAAAPPGRLDVEAPGMALRPWRPTRAAQCARCRGTIAAAESAWALFSHSDPEALCASCARAVADLPSHPAGGPPRETESRR